MGGVLPPLAMRSTITRQFLASGKGYSGGVARLLPTLLIWVLCLPCFAWGTVWTTPENIHPQSYFDDQFPKLAVPPGQAPWVFWLGGDSLQGDSEIYYSRWNGFGWDAAGLVNPPNATSESSPRVSYAQDGGLWVAWKSPNTASPGLYLGLATHWLGSGWSDPDTIWTSGGRLDVPAVAALSQDEAWIIRDGYAPGRTDSDIFIYHLKAGVADPEFRFEIPDSDETTPAITMDGSGNPWAVWYRLNWDDPPASRMWSSHHTAGGWSYPESIAAPLGLLAPKITTDSSGRLWIVTIAGDPGDPNAWRNSRTVWAIPREGDVWGPPLRISDMLGSPDTVQTQLSVSRVPGGNPRAVWIRHSQYSLTRLDLVTSAWDGAKWSVPERVGDVADSGTKMWPDIVDYAGETWAAYQRRAKTSPFNENVFALSSVGTPTSASDADLRVAAIPVGVRVSWATDLHAAPLFVRIHRAPASGPAGGIVPPPGSSIIVELDPERAQAGSHLDRLSVSGEYDYWMEIRYQAGAPEFVGPRRVKFEAKRAGGPRIASVLPNPSTGSITLRGDAGAGNGARLEIYDIAGRRVRSMDVSAGGSGTFEVTWDGRTQGGARAAAGVYFVQLRVAADGSSPTRRLLLLR